MVGQKFKGCKNCGKKICRNSRKPNTGYCRKCWRKFRPVPSRKGEKRDYDTLKDFKEAIKKINEMDTNRKK